LELRRRRLLHRIARIKANAVDPEPSAQIADEQSAANKIIFALECLCLTTYSIAENLFQGGG